jgi:hypothetical protein
MFFYIGGKKGLTQKFITKKPKHLMPPMLTLIYHEIALFKNFSKVILG